MPVQKITRKMRRGEAEAPISIHLDILDLLRMGRRSDGFQLPSLPHGTRKYNRKQKHKGRNNE